MTAAPLPAPLPCPFCGAEVKIHALVHGGTVWMHLLTDDRCPANGWQAYTPDAHAAWNRRAAPAWRAEDVRSAALEEAAKVADGCIALISAGPDLEFVTPKDFSVDALKDVADNIRALSVLAPPSATPAAPPDREAALVEALRFYADQSNWKRGSDEDWSQADTDGGQIARAALAEAEGRAG